MSIHSRRRLELSRRIAHLERQDRTLDVETLGEQHLGLAIEREMLAVFGDQLRALEPGALLDDQYFVLGLRR
jgi:hypothetical protein